MKLNQYAVYRVDQTSSGKALWRLPYDMVDGRLNNLPKQPEKTKAKKRKKKESVIGKLHKKQIEIAIRSGKPIPKYLEQNRELNRR